jgi:hypothetical protein
MPTDQDDPPYPRSLYVQANDQPIYLTSDVRSEPLIGEHCSHVNVQARRPLRFLKGVILRLLIVCKSHRLVMPTCKALIKNREGFGLGCSTARNKCHIVFVCY